jgi:hypothetical protein
LIALGLGLGRQSFLHNKTHSGGVANAMRSVIIFSFKSELSNKIFSFPNINSKYFD